MRYALKKAGGEVVEEFEGDAMTVNLKVDTYTRMYGEPVYVEEIQGLTNDHPGVPVLSRRAADPALSEQSTTAEAGLLEDPFSPMGTPQRSSPVLPRTTNPDSMAPPAVEGEGTKPTEAAKPDEDNELASAAISAGPRNTTRPEVIEAREGKEEFKEGSKSKRGRPSSKK